MSAQPFKTRGCPSPRWGLYPGKITQYDEELSMTAIRGYVAPTKETDALGVHSLDQFVLSVPDGAVAENFYGNFGLDVRTKGNVLEIKTFGHDHRWGSVVEGTKQKALHHLSFGCYAD